MLPCKREHQFRGPRLSKSIQNPQKNDTKNRSGNVTVVSRSWLPFYLILASKKTLKNDTKIDVKKHLQKRHLETWPTKESEARSILRSLAATISKRKRHDTTGHNSTRHDTRRHTHTHTHRRHRHTQQKRRKR